jgi:parallel beta-helix repeat protein
MHTPFAFLKFVARSALNLFGVGMVGELAVEVLPDLARDLWNNWGKGQEPASLRADLQEVAQAPLHEVREQAEALVLELASDQSSAVQLALVSYLTQIPAALRQSLRRPADPSGTTVPPALVLRQSQDLLTFLPARRSRFAPGQRPVGIGDWELVELLGTGGFGEVWKARNPHVPSATPVALKFCLDPTAARMLRHEAAILDRVMSHGRQHPGIVNLRHTYLSADPPCLEYDFVAGGDLGSVIQQWHQAPDTRPAALPFPELCARLLHELADIVAFAHRLDPPIVHRDLKPANILVQGQPELSGSLRVTDFGIGGVAAKQVIALTQRSTPAQVLATAARGACTPLYASPQQVRGEDPDPRDDVHALGVIWHQMLVGDLTAGRPSGRWMRRLSEMGMSDRLIDLLASCIEDRPDDRPGDAGVLTDAIARLLPDRPAVRTSASVPSTTGTGTPPTFVVSRLGRGQFTSLADAVRLAPAGSRLLVQPGQYPESVVIDKPLEILGDGPASEIILQCADGNCLVMQTDYAVVRGLTIRGRTGVKGGKYFAVDVPRGQLVLEECSLTSDSLSSLGIHGGMADPVIRRCQFNDGKECGIYLYEQAQATVEDCTFSGNGLAAITIRSGANPVVRRCQFRDGKASGIFVYENGLGLIERCEFHNNGLAAIEVKQGGNPIVRHCQMTDGKAGGVYVYERGQGTYEDCVITGNTCAGVEIKEEGDPVVRRCRVDNGKAGGLFVWQGGKGVIEDCSLSGNALTGVEIKQGGNPVVRRCTVQRNLYQAVYVHEKGEGLIENCDLTDNRHGPWNIQSGCSPRRRGNKE